MTQKKSFTIASGLYLLAAFIAAYLVYDHYQLVNGENFKSFCNINDYFNCDLVNSSQYSTILGLPLASWGLSFYIMGAFLSALASRSPYNIREVGFILLPLSLFSILGSIILAVISFGYIRAICLFCSSLYILNLATFIFIYLGSREHIFPVKQELEKVDRTRLAFFSGFGFVALAAVAGISLQMHHPLPFDVAQFAEVYQNAPALSIELGDSPRLGSTSDNPRIRLVEFSDFECPFCGRQAKELIRILRDHGDTVQLVFKNFPLDMSCNSLLKAPLHKHACMAAKAALCSNEQKKFDHYHEQLFTHQELFSPENFRTWAAESGMNMAAFEQCMANDRSAAILRQDITQGQSLGIASTPTFFINGRKVQGLVTEQAIRYLLDHPEGK